MTARLPPDIHKGLTECCELRRVSQASHNTVPGKRDFRLGIQTGDLYMRDIQTGVRDSGIRDLLPINL